MPHADPSMPARNVTTIWRMFMVASSVDCVGSGQGRH
jgi:hypothetical protein